MSVFWRNRSARVSHVCDLCDYMGVISGDPPAIRIYRGSSASRSVFAMLARRARRKLHRERERVVNARETHHLLGSPNNPVRLHHAPAIAYLAVSFYASMNKLHNEYHRNGGRRRTASCVRLRSRVDRHALTSVFTASSSRNRRDNVTYDGMGISFDFVKCYANCNHIVTDCFAYYLNTSV